MTVDHITQSLARLPEVLKGKTNVTAILTALIRPFQDLEDVFQDLLLLRGVLTATGQALTNIGNLVGEPRNGNTDDDYRRHIRARIFTNRSSGTISELIRIARLVIYDTDAHIHLEKQQVGVVVLQIHPHSGAGLSATMADIAINFLREAVSADGRIILESGTEADVDTFTLDTLLASQAFPTDEASDLLDLDPLCANLDTVVVSTISGPSSGRTIQLVADGSGAGSLTDGLAAVFHFQSGVTTVANFDDAMSISAYIIPEIPGTGSNVLSAGDVLAATALTGGVTQIAGGSFIDARE